MTLELHDTLKKIKFALTPQTTILSLTCLGCSHGNSPPAALLEWEKLIDGFGHSQENSLVDDCKGESRS